jgi:uncharacterized membrane protein YhiD involved in acid resistance
VHGLTTAASSWAAAAMGILVGAGAYLTAALGTILVLFLLELNRLPLYRRLAPNKHRGTVQPHPSDADDELDTGSS